MSNRVAWKLPFIHPAHMKLCLLQKPILNIYLRNACIPASLLLKKISVHNGIWWLSTGVTPEMIGRKYGEFSFGRRCELFIHGRNKKKRKKKLKTKKSDD